MQHGSRYDNYGGLKGISAASTGFFRLDNIEGRSFFITPSGNAYLSLGINHHQNKFYVADYNRAFWEQRFGAEAGSEKWKERFLEKLHSDMDYIGFNTVGIHNQESVKRDRPYVCSMYFVDHAYYLHPKNRQHPREIHFPDVFSPEFDKHCDQFAKEKTASVKADSYLLGYSFTDCPILTEIEAAPRLWSLYCKSHPGVIPWPRKLRNLGAGSTGKKVYTQLMAERYGKDINSFNSVYGTGFQSFDELLAAENWRIGYDLENSSENGDNTAFLHAIVDQYYKTAVAAVKRYDNNHLIFGDKMNWNTGFDDFVVKAAGKYCDVTFYQYYAFPDEHLELCERAYKLTGKPVYCGDSNFVTPEYPNMPYPYGPACSSPDDRARVTYLAMHTLFERPYFVGWDWCGLMDEWQMSEKWGQHSGIQNPFGEWHKPVADALRDVSLHLYDIARLRAGNMRRQDDWYLV